MKYTAAAILFFANTVYAGYGGMSSVMDETSDPDLGGMLLVALLWWAGHSLWKKYF